MLGDEQTDGGYAVRIYFNPLVRFIWLGALIMFFGGALSLSDRRLRVGAPGRARRLPRAVARRMSAMPCAASSAGWDPVIAALVASLR